jgi:hypothetical protein
MTYADLQERRRVIRERFEQHRKENSRLGRLRGRRKNRST